MAACRDLRTPQGGSLEGGKLARPISFPWDGRNGPDVLAAADAALLRAKALGKDRVERASFPDENAPQNPH